MALYPSIWYLPLSAVSGTFINQLNQRVFSQKQVCVPICVVNQPFLGKWHLAVWGDFLRLANPILNNVQRFGWAYCRR